MIPLVAIIRIRDEERGRRLFLWIPLFLIWLLLLPFVPLLVFVLLIICAAKEIDPIRALHVGFDFVAAFAGTQIEVESRKSRVEIAVL